MLKTTEEIESISDSNIPKEGTSFQDELKNSLATMDVVGRDQPDQKFYLKRNVETLKWELEKAENELWVEPSDPLLDSVASFVSSNNMSWVGSPTQLATLLDVDIKPNVLTLRLNINAGRLLKEYGISFKSSRCHDGRKLTLSKVEESPT